MLSTPKRLLLAALLVHAALHLPAAFTRQHMEFDDACSYVEAAGHQGDYARTVPQGLPPAGSWVPAATWKQMLTPDEPLVFRTIAEDLGRYDIHPPLYFWLLHLGLLGAGFHLWVGPLVNLGFDILSIFALYALARRVLGDERKAGLAALLWSVSPGPLLAALEARQYSLFALVSILFVRSVLDFLEDGARLRPRSALWLCFVTWLGLLTQYQFAILVGAAGVLLVLKQARRDPRRLAVALGALAAGAALMLPMHELVLASFQQQQRQLLPFDWNALFVRITSVFAAPSTFFVMGLAQQVLWVAAASAGLVGLRRSLRRRNETFRAAFSRLEPPVQHVFLLLSVSLGVATIAFLGFRTPAWVMQGKYLAWAHPMIACLLVRALHAFQPSSIRRFLYLVGLILLGNALWLDGQRIRQAHRIAEARRNVASVDRVVFDSGSRGLFFPAMLQLPDDTLVFAAPAKVLLDAPERWLPELSERSLWIHDPGGAAMMTPARMEGLLQGRLGFAPKEGPLWPRQVAYPFGPPPARKAQQEP
ncbi:glycosyltransferase family 39 protein [Polyangium mundeleinium]|uniref:Glycosyltransferase family 39 protein n=1 Tax=Polyangium mundeleinium TaxID=2995306 RepID=A0ABT5EXA3_9BACT|nr:glycosyltransferase family 39 protein [Polyangium mundeleinium]MDC0745818.1 glycosyltransferase family 39 protein [Polyangium mundeleinium]